MLLVITGAMAAVVALLMTRLKEMIQAGEIKANT
jgi:hypothetical protein